MTVAEILADNLRRLMNGKTVGEWTAENPTIDNYYDHQWMLKLLEGATQLTSLETLDNIAAHAGVAPWQLLAPLCGRAVWSPNPNGSLSLRTLPYCRRVGSIMVYTHTVMSEVPGRDPVMTHHDTEANARAAVEAALRAIDRVATRDLRPAAVTTLEILDPAPATTEKP